MLHPGRSAETLSTCTHARVENRRNILVAGSKVFERSMGLPTVRHRFISLIDGKNGIGMQLNALHHEYHVTIHFKRIVSPRGEFSVALCFLFPAIYLCLMRQIDHISISLEAFQSDFTYHRRSFLTYILNKLFSLSSLFKKALEPLYPQCLWDCLSFIHLQHAKTIPLVLATTKSTWNWEHEWRNCTAYRMKCILLEYRSLGYLGWSHRTMRQEGECSACCLEYVRWVRNKQAMFVWSTHNQFCPKSGNWVVWKESFINLISFL